MEQKKKFYAVARGRNTGIFTAWFGPGGAEAQIREFPGARYKGFPTIEEARQWLAGAATESAAQQKARAEKKSRAAEASVHAHLPAPEAETVTIFTDGGCTYNPGPGGYGVVLYKGLDRRELSGGFRLTTNNRMELTACIEGLKALSKPAQVTLVSDSKYVVDAMTKGWPQKWRSKGWMRTAADAAENYDLWDRLLSLCEKHRVRFVWVKGHAGHEENERCDRLATTAAAGKNLAHDTSYEKGRTKIIS